MSSWFQYFVGRSLAQRRGRFLIASSSVMLAVAVMTSLVTLSLGVREKIGAELKQYGANMIVTPRDGRWIGPAVADSVRQVSSDVKDATVQLYGTALLGKTSVEVIGMEPQRMTGYRLQGKVPQGADELMIGASLRFFLKAAPGDRVRFAGDPAEYRVSAVFEKGSEDDGAVVMPIDGARRLLGADGVSAILLNADTARLKEVAEMIRGSWPDLDVKTLRQVAVAEERILSRIQLLMLLVTAVVLFSAAVALGSTMTATVIERMEEIGLMKAIGATPADIRRFFMYEAMLAGLAGSAAGCVVGIAAAEAVSRAAFGSLVAVNLLVVPGAFILGVGIAVLATAVPVRDAMKVVPAKILRGE
jgi:putative ABC transport system permease protein